MTTNITELAQSLKAAAEKWQEAWGKYDKVEITIAEFIRAANQYESIVKDPANIIALVEALASEKRICATWRKTAEANSEKLDKAQQRISRLESRSVKLPKAMSIEGGAYCSAHAHYDSDGDYYDRTDVEEMLAAAGIKVEAE